MDNIRFITAAAALGLSASVASAALFSENFNSYDSVTGGAAPLSAAYNLANAAGVILDNAGGIGGSKALDFNTDTHITSTTAIDFAANKATGVRVSILFQYLSGNSSGQANPAIGITSGATDSPTSSGLCARINLSGGINLFAGGSNLGGAGTVALTSGNWYQLVGTFKATGVAGEVQMLAEVFNASSSGTVGTLISSSSILATGRQTILADTTMYPALRVSGRNDLTPAHSNRSANLDNFTVALVPEPAVIGMIGLSSVALLRRRRA